MANRPLELVHLPSPSLLVEEAVPLLAFYSGGLQKCLLGMLYFLCDFPLILPKGRDNAKYIVACVYSIVDTFRY